MYFVSFVIFPSVHSISIPFHWHQCCVIFSIYLVFNWPMICCVFAVYRTKNENDRNVFHRDSWLTWIHFQANISKSLPKECEHWNKNIYRWTWYGFDMNYFGTLMTHLRLRIWFFVSHLETPTPSSLKTYYPICFLFFLRSVSEWCDWSPLMLGLSCRLLFNGRTRARRHSIISLNEKLLLQHLLHFKLTNIVWGCLCRYIVDCGRRWTTINHTTCTIWVSLHQQKVIRRICLFDS